MSAYIIVPLWLFAGAMSILIALKRKLLLVESTGFTFISIVLVICGPFALLASIIQETDEHYDE